MAAAWSSVSEVISSIEFFARQKWILIFLLDSLWSSQSHNFDLATTTIALSDYGYLNWRSSHKTCECQLHSKGKACSLLRSYEQSLVAGSSILLALLKGERISRVQSVEADHHSRLYTKLVLKSTLTCGKLPQHRWSLLTRGKLSTSTPKVLKSLVLSLFSYRGELIRRLVSSPKTSPTVRGYYSPFSAQWIWNPSCLPGDSPPIPRLFIKETDR